MPLADPLPGLAVATGIGLLIGVERGWRLRNATPGTRVAGIRSHALLGLGGGLCGLASQALSPLFGLVGILGLIGALLLSHRERLEETQGNVSATEAIVGVLTALLGLLATSGFLREALIAGGSVALLLSMREKLHGWLQTLSQEDVLSAAQYGAIALVILPLLPDRNIGPYGALNPRMLWLVVVFVTGLSFAGYLASKRFGEAKGTILAAAIGATYSSTAVTIELARRLRREEESIGTLNAAIAAASATMPIRVMILCAVLIPSAIAPFATGIGLAILALLFYAIIAIWRAQQAGVAGMSPHRNPFEFWPAVGFAILVALIIIAARWTIDRYGNEGLTVLVGITGLYDVDAAIIMVSNLPTGSLPLRELGILLSLPILANNLLKAVLVLSLAGMKRGLLAAAPLLLASILIAGGIAVLWRGWMLG